MKRVKIHVIETKPCVVCGEPIELRRRLDGTPKPRQPRYCGYRCWYHAAGPRLREQRHKVKVTMSAAPRT
jgi:hypothetical protein